MNGALAQWWRLRSLREQRLLLVMFGLIILLLAWLLVIRPLADTLDSAKRRHAEAVAALAEARARAGAAGTRPSQAAPLPVDAHLARTANEAGFAGARIAAQGPARANVAIDAARPPAFFAWIRRMEQDGLVVEMLRARTNDDRTLAVEVALRARAPR